MTLSRPSLSSGASRLLSLVGLAVLTLLTGYLVYASTRPPAPPPELPVAVPGGQVAAQGPMAAYYAGLRTCIPTPSGLSAELVVTKHASVAVPLPMTGVSQLSLAPDGAGLAVGYDESCRGLAARATGSLDDWSRDPSLDGVKLGQRLASEVEWLLIADSDEELVVTTDAAGARHTSSSPCEQARADPAVALSAVDGDSAWILCESESGAGRLLMGTSDSGDSWQRLNDGREGFGSSGPALGLDFVDEAVGFFLVSSDDCDGGELRRSDDGGVSWISLGCPTKSGARVLNMDFADAVSGVALVQEGSERELWRSSDGGRSWVPGVPPTTNGEGGS